MPFSNISDSDFQVLFDNNDHAKLSSNVLADNKLYNLTFALKFKSICDHFSKYISDSDVLSEAKYYEVSELNDSLLKFNM
jgi:hypothetical protein